MYGFNSRALRGIMGGLLLALAACADEPTAPLTLLEPVAALAVGDVLMVTNTSGSDDIGSLRWVLGQIEGGEVIRFDPALAGQTIVLDTTIVIYGKPFTLEGPADGGITISGGGRVRVMDLDPGLPSDQIVLRNLTIANGNAGATGYAGGITVRGYTSAQVRLENSTLTGHVAGSNPAMHGINTVLVNSTVSGNTDLSPTAGGPTLYSTDIVLENSTIAHNTGGGVGGVLTMRNSLVSNNTGDNCTSGPVVVTAEEGNISDDSSCGTVFDLTIADPVLGPLADNGGPAMTHALLAGSPAINAGTNCTVGVDQRYAPRDAQCDLGAFEFVDFTTVALTVASSASIDKNGWAVLSGSVQCSRNETFELHVVLQQLQKSGRGEEFDNHAVSTTPITCMTSPLPWSVALVSTDAPFVNGSATATVTTMNTRQWVTPAAVTQTVKVVRTRR